MAGLEGSGEEEGSGKEEVAAAEPAAPTEQDLLCYSDRYPDLAAAFGKDLGALQRHWDDHGRSEARDPYCHL